MGSYPGGARPRLAAAALGRRGEEEAARYLERRGYRVVARGFRGRRGELDLVCRHRDHVVLVEVKTRSSGRWGTPAEAVGPRKRRALQTVVSDYRALSGWRGPISFAIVSVVWEERGVRIDLIEDAFD
jgi:putative endonuclease